MRTTDLSHGHSFTHFMCGTLSARNHAHDDNMFLYYENLGSDDMHIHLIRIFPERDKVNLKEEMVF